MHRRALLITVVSVLLCCGITVFANGQGATAATVDQTDADNAVTTAETVVNSATTKTEKCFNDATAAKGKADKLNEEQTRITQLKSGVETLAANVEGTSDALTKVTSSIGTAASKATEATTASSEAVSKAEAAKKNAENAKKTFDEAKAMGEDTTGNGSYKNKKDKVEEAQTAATSAETEATEAEKEVTKANTALKEFNDAIKTAEIALHEVKIIVAADKVKKAHTAVNGYASEATAQKTKATEHQTALTGLLSGQTAEMIANVKTEKETIDNAVTQAATELSEIEASVKKVEGYQTSADGAVREIASVTEVTKAQEQTSIAETAATSAEAEETATKQKLEVIKSAVTNAERAKHAVSAIVAVPKVDAVLSKMSRDLATANNKATEAEEAVKAITNLQSNLPSQLKGTVDAKLQTATSARDAVKDAITTMTASHKKVEQSKKDIDASAGSARAATDATSADTHAKKASEYAESASNEEKAFHTLLETVTSNAKTALLAKYTAEGTVASFKVDSSVAKIKEYNDASSKHQTDTEAIVSEMETMKSNAAVESQQRITQLVGNAKGFVGTLKEEAKKVQNALTTATAQKEAIKGLVTELESEADEASAKTKSTGIVNASQNAHEKENEAKSAMDKATEAAEKVQRAKYETHTVVASSRAAAAAKKARIYAQNATEKKDEANKVVDAMKQSQKSATAPAIQELSEKVKNAEKLLETIVQKNTEAQNLAKEAEAQKSAIDGLLVQIQKAETNAITAKGFSDQATSAANTSAQKAAKAKEALQHITAEAGKVSLAKASMDQLMEQSKAKKKVEGNHATDSSSKSAAKKEEMTEEKATDKQESHAVDGKDANGSEEEKETLSSEQYRSEGSTTHNKEQTTNTKPSDSTVIFNTMVQMTFCAFTIAFAVAVV